MTARADRPTAIIFRKRILPWSETFIAAQTGAMTRYAPVLVGYSRDPGGAAYLVGRPQLLLNEHSRFPALEKLLLKSAGRAPRRWLRAIAETKPVVLHAHFGSSALPASRIARALHVPLVVTYHGMDITVAARTEAEAARRRRAFAAADCVIAVSNFIADALRAAGCPADRITVHYIGVDTARFSPGSERRANAVKDYLVSRDIPANRINASGNGETQPVTKASDCPGEKSAKVIACLASDRRVDVEATGSKGLTTSSR